MKKPSLKGQQFTKLAHDAAEAVKHGAQSAAHGVAVAGVTTAKFGLKVADPALHKFSDFVEHNPELWEVADRAIDNKEKIHPTAKGLLKKGLREAHRQIQNGNFADFMARAHAYVAKKEAALKVKQPSREGLQVMDQAAKGLSKVSFQLPEQGFGRTA